MGGYTFAFSDATSSPPGGSSACVESSAFCGKGLSAAIDPANYTDPYGGGIGVNLNQVLGATPAEYTPTGTGGVAYSLSDLPAGTRLVIDNDGVEYCANLTSATGTVTWGMFTPMCYLPASMQGTALANPPVATHIEFEIPSPAAAESWDFCVTALSFAP
jgi:hypothetical protein